MGYPRHYKGLFGHVYIYLDLYYITDYRGILTLIICRRHLGNMYNYDRFSMTMRRAVAQAAIPLSSLMSLMTLSRANDRSPFSINRTTSSNAVHCDTKISIFPIIQGFYLRLSSLESTLLIPVSEKRSSPYSVPEDASEDLITQLIHSQASHYHSSPEMASPEG